MIPDTSPRGENVADDEAWDLGQDAGFYLGAPQEPWAKHYKMYTYTTEELTAIACSLASNYSGKERIMGHSMGGHSALVTGMKNTERFKAISASSPIFSPSQVPWRIKAFTTYLGENQTS